MRTTFSCSLSLSHLARVEDEGLAGGHSASDGGPLPDAAAAARVGAGPRRLRAQHAGGAQRVREQFVLDLGKEEERDTNVSKFGAKFILSLRVEFSRLFFNIFNL